MNYSRPLFFMAVALSLCFSPTKATSAAPLAFSSSMQSEKLVRSADEEMPELTLYLGQSGVSLTELVQTEVDEKAYYELVNRLYTKTYTSSNKQIATIDDTGAIECLSAGATILTATATSTKTGAITTFTFRLNVINGAEWSAATFSAVLGQEPAYPTLTYPDEASDIFNDVSYNASYQSSNEEVASINVESGAITLYKEGSTTITAHIKKTEIHGEFDVSYVLNVMPYEVTGSVEAINLSAPGELRYALAELESTAIGKLTLTGKMGSDDLNVLFQHTGRLSNLQVLDMQDVELVADDGMYAYNSQSSDIGMGSSTNQYFLSTREEVEESSSLTGLGGANHVAKLYTMNLSGLLCGNTSIVKVTMPRSMEKVGERTFYGCTALQEVVLPEGITEVEEYAFTGCCNLRTHNLQSLRIIGERAFSEAFVSSIDLSKVDSLGEYAFYNSRILYADLSAMPVIPKNAFYMCSNLKSVKLTDNTTEIQEWAFARTGLTELTLPNGLTTLGQGALANSSIGELSLPATLRFVEADCFYGTPWLLEQTPIDNVIYAGHIAYSVTGSTTITSLSLREGTTVVAEGFASSAYESLTSITFPSSLKVIGEKAFYHARQMKYALPDNIEWIGEYAFYGNTVTTSLNVPASVEFVGQGAFSNSTALLRVDYNAKRADSRIFQECTALERVTIGSNVEIIPYMAFQGCSSLFILDFEEDIKTKAAGGESKKLTFDDFCFNSTLLRSVQFPARTDSIGARAFNGTQLAEANLIKGVRSVGTYAFANCSSLTTVYLPKNIEALDGSAFYKDPVSAIYSYKDTPPAIVGGYSSAAHFTSLASTARVYTKYEDVYTYDADPVWTNFTITDMDEAHLVLSIGNVSNMADKGNQPVYDISGRRVTNPLHGLYIIDGKKVVK